MTQSVWAWVHGLCHGVLKLHVVSLSLTGMVIRPKADETFEIVYNIQNTESWDMYAQALDRFLARKSDLWVFVRWLKQLTAAADYPTI